MKGLLVFFIFFFRLYPGELLMAQQRTGYQVFEDIPYAEDREQKMDIYLPDKEKANGNKDFTIGFLHGGAYYASDKKREERYIEPYLKKGFNVVNLNYRLKRGIPLATSDLTHALNFLKARQSDYSLNLSGIIVTGFSAGAQICTNVALAQNNREFPETLDDGIDITGVINFSGPVGDLEFIEKIFIDHENESYSTAGKALFPAEGYASKEVLAVYEPATYFDDEDPPVFLWHGGMDDQIPPATFRQFVSMMREDKDFRMFIPDGKHSPNQEEFDEAYEEIFEFLQDL
ncbi:alpha/beta hydrolase [Catalinimonas sp. 4WD22]|uniref:alpha/beta hydrolase n=1 Tax=Catalinimonas locisalis TaxID=3133978 RepID=UPI003101291A